MANNNQKEYSPTIYSQYAYANPEGVESSSRLAISYWNNLMKIAIFPKDLNNDNKYLKESDAEVYLPYIKTSMLSKAIDLVISGEQKTSGINVSSSYGSGYIGISKSDLGIYILTILIFNENKQIVKTAIYEFKSNHYYLINNISVSDNQLNDFEKSYLPDLELEMFKNALDQFTNAMTYAIGYTYLTSSQFDGRLNQLFPIASKLGVSNFNNNSRSKAVDVFASDSSNEPINTGSLDDIL